MLAVIVLFLLGAGDQVRVNWLAPPACVPVPEYSTADFTAILGGDKPTPTDEAFRDCPLEAYDSQQRTAILKSLARSHDGPTIASAASFDGRTTVQSLNDEIEKYTEHTSRPSVR